MAFPTDDLYLGPATFGKRRGTEGLIWHTTEAAGTSRADAVGTAEWQKRNPGSYNFIIYDGGILLTVPYLEASGGVNPFSTSWSPYRYAALQRELTPAAFADPNAFLLNVAFSGKTAVFRDVGMPPNMVDTARRLVEWAEGLWGPMFHCGHFQWQTNRSDPSQKVLDLISAPAPEDDMALVNFTPIVNRRAVIAKGAAARSQPAFDRNDYDAGLIATEPNQRTRTATAWVDGTNLTLSTGTVYDARKRWLLTDSDSHGAIFYHERDVLDFQVIETVPTGLTQADVDAAVAAAVAAFNKNLDVWTGTRPKS
jgi:hypothetical protein